MCFIELRKGVKVTKQELQRKGKGRYGNDINQ